MTVRSSGAVVHGLTTFAGVMLMISSAFQILDGIALIFGDRIAIAGTHHPYLLDLGTWGWVLLALGVISLAAGVALVTGALGFLIDDRDRVRRPPPIAAAHPDPGHNDIS
jgi:hypothetical protein